MRNRGKMKVDAIVQAGGAGTGNPTTQGLEVQNLEGGETDTRV